jgi:hypothetical protein
LQVSPGEIAADPDGALWFTAADESGFAGIIGRITTSGSISEYPIPASGLPNDIVSGSDGAMWFTFNSNNYSLSNDIIGRIDTSGNISDYQIPTRSADPVGITVGFDGNIWFTEEGINKIGQLIVSSTIPVPSTPTNQYPTLSWTGVTGATSYNVYRTVGTVTTLIGNTTNTTYTDSSLATNGTSDGTYTYTVTAVNTGGESSPSNQAIVVYDTTPPVVTLTGAINGETYAANNTPTPVCTTGYSLSGVATDAMLSTSNSGDSYTATCSGATDNAGNLTPPISVTYTILPANYTLVNFADSNGNNLNGAKVTIENSSSQITTLSTDSFGNAFSNTTPGTYKVTIYYANGYESQNITVTANGPNNLSFTTVPVTVTINDPNTTDLANATVAQAGNTGTFGSKQPVNGNGQITFQVLPGTSTFTAYVANGDQQQSITASPTNDTVTFNTDAVQVFVTKNGNPLTTATVKHAGNTGSYGSNQTVNGSGEYTFYVLPGTNYFEAFDGPNNHAEQTLNVTGNTSTTIAVN